MATVYIIRAIGVGMIKVGITTDVPRRFFELSSASPVPLEIVDLLEGVGFEAEKTIHNMMSAHRSHSEWFRESGISIAERWFDIIRQSSNNVAELIYGRCPAEELPRLLELLTTAGAENIALALKALKEARENA